MPPPMNPWGLNYPLVSPPPPGGVFSGHGAGRNTPVFGNMAKKKIPPQPVQPQPPAQPPPPPQPPDSRQEEERLVPAIPLPNRSPGGPGMKPGSFTPTSPVGRPPSPGKCSKYFKS